MMQSIKCIAFFCFLLFFFTTDAYCQADSVWMTTHGGLGTDEWKEVVLCKNGDLVVVGTTSSDLAHGNEVYLARVDSLHHCIWTKTLGAFGVELGHDVVEDTLGNLWCLATVNGANSNGYDVLLLEFSGDGVELHQFLIQQEGIQWAQKLGFDGHHTLLISAIEVNASGGRDVKHLLFDTQTLTYEVFSIPVINDDLEITVTEWDSLHSQWLLAGNAIVLDSIHQAMGWGIGADGVVDWESINDSNADSLRVFDAIWKNTYWVLAGTDWVGYDWRAQIVKWIPGQNMQKMGSFSLTNGETLFHSVEHRSTGNGFVFGGWTYDMGAGLSDAYIHAFDDDFNWDGGAIFGGSKEDKINSLVNDNHGKLHWVGLNGSYHVEMQTQSWLARLNAGYVQSSDIHLVMENDDCFELSVIPLQPLQSIKVYYQDGQIWLSDRVDEVKIFDIQGALIRSERQSQNVSLDSAPGCYILQWTVNGSRGVQRVMMP
jgi:hypothetical protein